MPSSHPTSTPIWARLCFVSALLLIPGHIGAQNDESGQDKSKPEQFTATAIVNNNLASGAGQLLISISRWSSPDERETLVSTLLENGPDALLKALQKTKAVGSIRTPDSLAYDLHYARATMLATGGRRIVLATDRPIGFWEAANQPRTIDYPFTVIQMEIGADGKGKGTLSYATKISAHGDTIELENFATAPVMLTNIREEGGA
jgi:hypothetical protein